MKSSTFYRIMGVGRIAAGLFWILVFLGFWRVFPDFWSRLLLWAGGIILALHVLELVLLRRRLEEQVTEVRYHQFLILAFGVFHWMPLLSGSSHSSGNLTTRK